MNQWAAAVLLAITSAMAHAMPVPVQYQITTKGTGPGAVPATVSGVVSRLESAGSCGSGVCLNDTVEHHFVTLPDVAFVPQGQVNILSATFAGGNMYELVGTFGWSTDCGCTSCPGNCAGVTTACAGASSCTTSARIPSPGGPYNVQYDYTQRLSGKLFCAFGCQLLGHMGAHEDSATLTVTYLKQSPNAPKACLQLGDASVEPDDIWHQVASATCMQSPDTASAWMASVALSGTDTGLAIEGVMTSVNPNLSSTPYPNGSKLWVKIKPSCEGCMKPVKASYKQCNPQWKNEFLDGSNKTICKSGCLMVCMGMVLGIDPNVMNVELSVQNQDYFVVSPDPRKDGNLEAKKAAALYKMKYEKTPGSGATEELIRKLLCDEDVLGVIVELCSLSDPFNPEKSHFVVVTGEVPGEPGEKPCRFTIADPANPGKVFLDDYTDFGCDMKSVRRLFK